MGIDKLNHDKIPVDFGDILRIDSNGNISKERFETADNYNPRSNYYQYPMYMYGSDDDWGYQSEEEQYLTMLKQMSGLYGYSPEDIDDWILEGWTCGEIELMLYESDIYENEEEIYERLEVKRK